MNRKTLFRVDTMVEKPTLHKLDLLKGDYSFGIHLDSILRSEEYGERRGIKAREKRYRGKHRAGEDRRTEAKGGHLRSEHRAGCVKGGRHKGEGGGRGRQGGCQQEKSRCSG